MDTFKLLAIAPYDGMRELMENIADQHKEIDMKVCVGDLEDGAAIAADARAQYYSAIISRGGTAQLIRKRTDLPVVEITLNVYDILRAIKLAQNYDGSFAIVGFPSITKPARLLCTLLQYSADILTINSENEVDGFLGDLKTKEISLVVGDMVTVTHAKKAGMNAILITSGGESIEEAIDRAVTIAMGNASLQKRFDVMDAALQNGSTRTLVLDACENTLYSNLGEDAESVLQLCKHRLPDVLSGGGSQFLRQTRSGMTNVSGCRISIPSISDPCAYFEISYTPFFSLDMAAVKCLERDEVNYTDFDSTLPGAIGKLAPMISAYAKSDLPILLVGEHGTGKERIAASLFLGGRFRANTFVIIDFAAMDGRMWDQLVGDDRSPLFAHGLTIYMKGLEELGAERERQLVAFIESSALARRSRLIFAHTAGVESGRCKIFDFIKTALDAICVKLPPLRDRLDELPSLSSLYINALNAALGKTVIGFSPDALQLLRGFDWCYNLDQLHRVLRELVLLTDSPYISVNDTESVLRTEAQDASVSYKNDRINLSGTLNSITRDIVMRVLQEENMNQSHAAQRLGISRSTLWRMMK